MCTTTGHCSKVFAPQAQCSLQRNGFSGGVWAWAPGRRLRRRPWTGAHVQTPLSPTTKPVGPDERPPPMPPDRPVDERRQFTLRYCPWRRPPVARGARSAGSSRPPHPARPTTEPDSLRSLGCQCYNPSGYSGSGLANEQCPTHSNRSAFGAINGAIRACRSSQTT